MPGDVKRRLHEPELIRDGILRLVVSAPVVEQNDLSVCVVLLLPGCKEVMHLLHKTVELVHLS